MTTEPITQEVAPKFKAVPVSELPKEAVPDSAPKRRGRPPRDPNAPPVTRTRKPRSMETQIGSALVTVNLPLMMFVPGDALDEYEVVALAKALDAQAQTSPAFRKYLQAALDASSGGQLIVVGGMIVARRLARHGILLPKEADDQLGAVLSGNLSSLGMTPPVPEPVTPEPSANGTGNT